MSDFRDATLANCFELVIAAIDVQERRWNWHATSEDAYLDINAALVPDGVLAVSGREDGGGD